MRDARIKHRSAPAAALARIAVATAQSSRKSFMPARRLSLVAGTGFCIRGAWREMEAATTLLMRELSQEGGSAVASTGSRPVRAIVRDANGNRIRPTSIPRRNLRITPPLRKLTNPPGKGNHEPLVATAQVAMRVDTFTFLRLGGPKLRPWPLGHGRPEPLWNSPSFVAK